MCAPVLNVRAPQNSGKVRQPAFLTPLQNKHFRELSVEPKARLQGYGYNLFCSHRSHRLEVLVLQCFEVAFCAPKVRLKWYGFKGIGSHSSSCSGGFFFSSGGSPNFLEPPNHWHFVPQKYCWYKWEASCGTKSEGYCGRNRRCIAAFPFLLRLRASKEQRYKWGGHRGTNWRCTAVLFRQVVRVGGF